MSVSDVKTEEETAWNGGNRRKSGVFLSFVVFLALLFSSLLFVFLRTSTSFFFLLLLQRQRPPPALARRHQPFAGDHHGVKPDVVRLDGNASRFCSRHHLVREGEADEERARAAALLLLQLLFHLSSSFLLPRRPPRAVRPRVVVPEASPEPLPLSVESDPGEEEGVEVRRQSCVFGFLIFFLDEQGGEANERAKEEEKNPKKLFSPSSRGLPSPYSLEGSRIPKGGTVLSPSSESGR